MKVIAHRGASGYTPENTLAAFKKALELGADMVELDVQVLLSGEVVVFHEYCLEHTTSGHGYIENFSLEELRQLDAGGGESIPTLEEVIEFIDRRIPIDVEMRGRGCATSVADIVKKYLRRGWQPQDFLVSSFDHHDLKLFKELMPHIPVAALHSHIPLDHAAFAQELSASAVCPGWDFISPEYVEDAHARGLQIYAWPVNDPEYIRFVHRLGVDGIFTDFPDVSRRIIQAYEAELVAL